MNTSSITEANDAVLVRLVEVDSVIGRLGTLNRTFLVVGEGEDQLSANLVEQKV